MGQVGFSAGLEYGGRRLPIQYIYDNRIALVSESTRKYSNIPKELYEDYLNDLKKSAYIHDKFIASNKVEVDFGTIDTDTLSLILEAANNLAKAFKNNAEK
ncbi:hypothetical protein HN588_08975 [Candidatus Bathyarchaeota archaeon]|jgi:hypothetical protein|nr:hypothetical protein [Candidatus Bathyarchaeota archaeon]